MARNRFADVTTTRITISDGDWFEVKNGIDYGEKMQIESALMTTVRAGEDEIGINWAKHKFLKMETWLVDWSLRDKNDKPVKLSRQTIRSLDPDTAVEIDDALTRHIDAKEAEKKAALATANGSG